MFDFIKDWFQPTKPKAKLSFQDGKLQVTGYNVAFVKDLRARLGDVTDGKTDEEVIKLYVDRENIEREEPRLEVIHSGLEPDGRVKMELDWNRAFIKQLQENGITGETEEEAIQAYLTALSHEVDPDVTTTKRSADELVGEAFRELDEQSQRELDEAEKLVLKAQRAEAKAKREARRKQKPAKPTPPAARIVK